MAKGQARVLGFLFMLGIGAAGGLILYLSLSPEGQRGVPGVVASAAKFTGWVAVVVLPIVGLVTLVAFVKRRAPAWKAEDEGVAVRRPSDDPMSLLARELEEGEAILARQQKLVRSFNAIAERKYSARDEYGDKNQSALQAELNLCMQKIAAREGAKDMLQAAIPSMGTPGSLARENVGRWAHVAQTLLDGVLEHHRHLERQPTTCAHIDEMHGQEFETHIIRLLEGLGFRDVRGTVATGDQGADVIAVRPASGAKVIIQAKRYSSPVGNKAVQEVIAALQYYGGDEAWVVTNSTFTPSARALAQRAGVRLIDGASLADPVVAFGE